jgi:hypothetical protein
MVAAGPAPGHRRRNAGVSSRMGRFDRSFAIRMIRDFLIALTAIVVVELGGRYLLALYEFRTEDREATELAAERLATDVKDIMLNRGGPVAARTVYPIIRRNQEELGLEIAIVPSELTVQAIENGLGFTPLGIPPEWSDGDHHEASVELVAESFCTTCHTTAEPGDVLGHVTVRSYRALRMSEWWHEARLISVVGMGNVILHTIVLFLLLRIRMEPLLRLRATVGQLAKGRLDLGQRAALRSDDEFGELAQDLNHFLDRVTHLVEDLEDVLGKVAAINQRLGQVSSWMGGRIESVQAKTRDAMRRTFEIQGEIAGPWQQAVDSLDLALAALAKSPEAAPESEGLSRRLAEVLAQFRESAAGRYEAAHRLEKLGEVLGSLSGDVADDTHYMGEIQVLEERMRVVAETGQGLLARLRHSRAEDA